MQKLSDVSDWKAKYVSEKNEESRTIAPRGTRAARAEASRPTENSGQQGGGHSVFWVKKATKKKKGRRI